MKQALLPRMLRAHVVMMLLMSAGCGGSAKQWKVAPVTGKVSYKSAPVPMGTVTFIPMRSGPTATGEIDKDGNYSLTTPEGGKGAVVGSYKVIITAVDYRPGLPEDPNAGIKALIPEKYSDVEKSGLAGEVKEDKNVIDFNLAD